MSCRLSDDTKGQSQPRRGLHAWLFPMGDTCGLDANLAAVGCGQVPALLGAAIRNNASTCAHYHSACHPTVRRCSWGVKLLSLGLLGIIFMTEISVGASTAAIWAGEPFGTRKILGITLIPAAGLRKPVRDIVARRAS